MFLTVAAPDNRRLLLDFVDLVSRHGIQSNVDNQNDADGEVKVDRFDVSVILQPAARDAHQGPPFIRDQVDGVNEEQNARQQHRNSKSVKAVE